MDLTLQVIIVYFFKFHIHGFIQLPVFQFAVFLIAGAEILEGYQTPVVAALPLALTPVVQIVEPAPASVFRGIEFDLLIFGNPAVGKGTYHMGLDRRMVGKGDVGRFDKGRQIIPCMPCKGAIAAVFLGCTAIRTLFGP